MTEESDIIYIWNPKSNLDDKTYTRHSQLNGGKAVICAGEFYIDQSDNILNLYIDVNNQSGHYKPEFGCLSNFESKFNSLGISSDKIKLFFHNAPFLS